MIDAIRDGITYYFDYYHPIELRTGLPGTLDPDSLLCEGRQALGQAPSNDALANTQAAPGLRLAVSPLFAGSGFEVDEPN